MDVSRPLAARVGDIGLARGFHKHAPGQLLDDLTSGQLAGTLSYVAPERLSGAVAAMRTADEDRAEQGLLAAGPITSALSEAEILDGGDLARGQGAKDAWALGVLCWELANYSASGNFTHMFEAVAHGQRTDEETGGSHMDGLRGVIAGDIPPFAAGPGLSRMRAVAAAALQLHPLARPSCAEIAAMLGGSRPEFAKSESE